MKNNRLQEIMVLDQILNICTYLKCVGGRFFLLLSPFNIWGKYDMLVGC